MNFKTARPCALPFWFGCLTTEAALPSLFYNSRKASATRVPRTIMRSFIISALVSTVATAPATIFNAGDAPHCFVSAEGKTVVRTGDAHEGSQPQRQAPTFIVLIFEATADY